MTAGDRVERALGALSGLGLIYVAGHAFAAGGAVTAVLGAVLAILGLILVGWALQARWHRA